MSRLITLETLSKKSITMQQPKQASTHDVKNIDKTLFKPIKKNRLYEDIVDYVKQLIIQGELKPSDKLPSERDLAERFAVGRPTVREAIRTLELMGLVEVHHGQKGTTIKNPELDTYMDSVREQMSWMIQIKRTTLQQLAEVRDSLETRIALLAAERATKGQLMDMKTTLEEMKSCTEDVDAYLEKGIEFHRVMARATQNPIFHATWTAFADLIFKYYKDLLEGLSNKKILNRLYLANVGVYQAILTKNPQKIRVAMIQHIDAESEILWPDKGARP